MRLKKKRMLEKKWLEKIERARKVEQEILLWFQKTHDPKATLSQGYNAECDIISSKGCVEIKEDRLAHQTGNYALEFITHDDKPSGFMGSTSDYFVIVDWEYVLVMSTQWLRDYINEMEVKKKIEMGETFNDGKRNKGYLIPRDKLLNNEMVQVLERWFSNE